MEQRYFFELSYSGKAYAGWQIQPRVNTVQKTIQNGISKLFSNRSINVVGCGRTDTGVHATKYYLHVDLPNRFENDQLRYKLNKILPSDIAIHNVIQVKPDAHARFDAISRTYIYKINTFKNPFLNDLSWFHPVPLDLNKMNAAALHLLGKKDFTSFSRLHTDVRTNICEVTVAYWEELENGDLIFKISANRFLRNMVRAVVGTLVDVGRGKTTSNSVKEILLVKNRSAAGTSAPAHGLYLSDVSYEYINRTQVID